MVHSADPAQRGGTQKRHGRHGQASQVHLASPAPRPPLTAAARSLAISRRRLLLTGGGLAAAFAGLESMRHLATIPTRLAASQAATGQPGMGLAAASAGLPDVQFNISAFTAPALAVDGITVAFPPVYTLFAPARLRSRPTRSDAAQLANAMNRVEEAYPFAPQGVFAYLAYGLPYFSRFPGWMSRTMIPRLTSDNSRFALEEAVPSPTDVSRSNPGIIKQNFNVPVRIERNDMLLTVRSDNADHLTDVMAFLSGSNRLAGESVPSPRLTCGLTFATARVMFVQRGLPRSVADANKLPFAPFVNPGSPMWLGFADQQVDASAPAPNVTFAGGGGIELTTASAGDYFDNGSLQHLAHDILDLRQWFDLDAGNTPGDDGTFLERVQYMYRSTPPPSLGNTDQFTDGGGPAFLNNVFQGTDDALRSAEAIGTPDDPDTGEPEHRMGHLSTLQRSSRTPAGAPMHQRMDGPGFDSLDVPDGSKQPKLEFSIFVPTADFFRTMRVNQASLDLQKQFAIEATDNGLERFMTATRRQNFLVPPRRHRAFPFAELGG
jgi:hypothetical protein